MIVKYAAWVNSKAYGRRRVRALAYFGSNRRKFPIRVAQQQPDSYFANQGMPKGGIKRLT